MRLKDIQPYREWLDEHCPGDCCGRCWAYSPTSKKSGVCIKKVMRVKVDDKPCKEDYRGTYPIDPTDPEIIPANEDALMRRR